MRFSLLWLFILVTVFCATVGWCVYFQLSFGDWSPTAIGIVGWAVLLISLRITGEEQRLGVAIIGALIQLIEAITCLHKTLTGFHSSLGSPWGEDWVVDVMQRASAGAVVSPAIALLFVFSSLHLNRTTLSSKLFLVVLVVAWITLVLHIVLAHVVVAG